ncbi:hypothetical protein PRZ48_005777 [Zasmidium cellare]|uniref:NADP-dependent oxidoreductase domain-containing protein n=1 Tax=Zasmidium cellare TaxID=395010 RepID=A0ABR0ELA7_ZASCE|nr:hypothetical protein PRZ48_005777 [Zasmidium cellare]
MAATKAARVPSLIYGTAWKKEKTQELVKQALLNGFTGVDTAAQPKHYQEDLVGAGIRDALKDGQIRREDLYIQTKFTSIHGQDPKKMPYDPKKTITEQVNASVASSLQNLRHTDNVADSYIDCLVLHSPFPSMSQTQEAWRAMESHVPHSVRTLGISNTYQLSVLKELYNFAKVKPSVLQNRFYQDAAYDRDTRVFCEEKDIKYQSFWTLTANPHLLRSEPVNMIAKETGVTKPVALYALVIGLGNVSVLNGTTNIQRMEEDIAGIQAVDDWKAANLSTWDRVLKAFDALLD